MGQTKEAQHEWLVVRSLRATVRLQKAEQAAHLADWRHGELKLVTKLIKGNKIGVEVEGRAESSRNILAVACESFFSVDSARASVTIGELAQLKEVQQMCAGMFYQRSLKETRC